MNGDPNAASRAAAHELAAAGASVVPIRRGAKRPDLARGRFRASFERAASRTEIDEWFAPGSCRRGPGLSMGRASGNRFGLDFDDARALDYCAAASEPGQFPSRAPLVRTGRGAPGGRHLHLRSIDPEPPRTTTFKRRPGTSICLPVDVAGHGHMLAMPPHVHETGREYAWIWGEREPPTPVSYSSLIELLRQRAEEWPYVELSLEAWTKGERHDLVRGVAGFLLRDARWARERVRGVVRGLAAAAGEPEVREDWDRAVDEIAERVRRDEPVQVQELLGDDAFSKFRRLLNQAGAEAVGGPDGEGASRLFDDEGRPGRAAFVEAIMTERPFASFEDTEELLVFEGGRYAPGARPFIHRWIEQRFRERGEAASVNFRREVVETVRARSYVPRDRFNPPGLLALKNGLFDLRNPKGPTFGPHDPAVLLTYALPIAYDPGATCTRFHAFLFEIQPDAATRALLQEEFGYCLVPGNRHKVAFFWVGAPDTGKSTLLAILKGLLGPKNVSAVSLQSLADNRFASAVLFGKLANLHADLSSRMIRETGTFKMLTGGTDEVPAEKKFQPAFSFVNGAKLFFSANEMPPVPSADEAFHRRWILTEFQNRIPLEKQDPELASALLAGEGPGILNWAIQGLIRLAARGRFDLPATVAETGRMWRWLSNSLSWFVETEVIRDPRSWVPKADIYARYTEWCEEHNAEPRSQTDVGRDLPGLVPGLRASFPKPGGKGTKSIRSWCGIRLRSAPAEGAAPGIESYAMAETGVEPVEPVEPAPDSGPGSTGSTGSTGSLRMRTAETGREQAVPENGDAPHRPGGRLEGHDPS